MKVCATKISPVARFIPLHLFIIALCSLLTGCGPYDPKSAADLAKCYEVEFGTLPPSGITVVQARQTADYYGGTQWLQLQADTNLIDSLILIKFKKENHSPRLLDSSKDKHRPAWWVLPPAEQLEFYTAHEWTRGNWNASSAALAVHRANGMVYFRCDRID